MLGRTNTGGGGTGGILTVTAPAGVTVTVSKDGKSKTKTANADGVAVFKGLATGSWTLTITDGTQTATKMVDITADYNSVIAFFSATISITYPAGSICTCSDGSTTFTAPDTGGSWVCVVPNAGTWTVKATNGTSTATDTVTITEYGQNESVTLTYIIYLFKDGSFHPDYYNNGLAFGQYFYVDSNRHLVDAELNIVRKFNPMDVTHAYTVSATVTGSWGGTFHLVIYTTSGTEVAHVSGNTIGQVLTIDISSLEGQYVVGLYAMGAHPSGGFNVAVRNIAVYY